MSKPVLHLFAGSLALLWGLAAGGAALAEDKIDLIGGFNDWDAFTMRKSDGEKLCYMVSTPKSTKASKANVLRGDIYVIVTHRPKVKVRDQVNVVAGYPYKEKSETTATIDGKTRFTLFTEGDGAWLFTSKDDSNMVKAMRRGKGMVVTGISSRGTTTTDYYSLSGFTAAHNAMSRTCAG